MFGHRSTTDRTHHAIRRRRTLPTVTETEERSSITGESLRHALSSTKSSKYSLFYLCSEQPLSFQFRQFRQEQIETNVAIVYESINKIRSYRSAKKIVSKTKDNRK